MAIRIRDDRSGEVVDARAALVAAETTAGVTPVTQTITHEEIVTGDHVTRNAARQKAYRDRKKTKEPK